ncbi:putative Fibroblast growth factor receptor 3 [Hypsibius exemplaris]|uniref:receptor protein-tyrosine kinase n=1 Tax=Hypsibius exemplaris TaxID=2072580 RepID=A0A1W0X454_HYPEX|nr:putative Fibroblast growth factor receptor 3 [Hypsibius exemplaris]
MANSELLFRFIFLINCFSAVMSTLPPVNLQVLRQVLDTESGTINATISFTRQMSTVTECSYDFQFWGSDAKKEVTPTSYTISETDTANTFVATGLAPGRAYVVRVRTHCRTLTPEYASAQFPEFMTLTCLQATNGDLTVCAPPPPTNLEGHFASVFIQSGTIDMALSWNAPTMPALLNGSLPVITSHDLSYEVIWQNKLPLNAAEIPTDTVLTRSTGSKVLNDTKAILHGLLPNYDYTITVRAFSSKIPSGKVASIRSEKAEIKVPQYVDPSLSTLLPASPLPSPATTATSTTLRSLNEEMLLPTHMIGLGVGLFSFAFLCAGLAFLKWHHDGKKKREAARPPLLPTITRRGPILQWFPNRKSRTPAPVHNHVDNDGYRITWMPKITLLPPYQGSVSVAALTNLEEIARGAFGVVYRARLSIPSVLPVEVAVKSIEGTGADLAEKISNLMSEINIITAIPAHPNIISIIGKYTAQDHPFADDAAVPLPSTTPLRQPFFLTEFCTNGDLGTFLRHHERKQFRPTRRLLRDLAIQAAEGMAHLAAHHIVHRDLAARNVLITAGNQAKITDFGLSRVTQTYYRMQQHGKMPWKWLAPESLRHALYSTKSDVWAFGVLLWELESWGRAPWADVDSILQLEGSLERGERMKRPPGCTPEVYALMCCCWDYAPENRPDFSDIITQLRQLTIPPDYDYVIPNPRPVNLRPTSPRRRSPLPPNPIARRSVDSAAAVASQNGQPDAIYVHYDAHGSSDNSSGNAPVVEYAEMIDDDEDAAFRRAPVKEISIRME